MHGREKGRGDSEGRAVMVALNEDGRGEYKGIGDSDADESSVSHIPSKRTSNWLKAFSVLVGCAVIYLAAASIFSLSTIPSFSGHQSQDCSTSTASVPQYFQTSPELWAGPTATGKAPFLAQTNAVSFAPTATYVPNDPLETGMPIVGAMNNGSIFHLMGQLSPYFPNPRGFGVAEYPLPPGANITQVQVRSVFFLFHASNSDQMQMLSRHGSRYPTTGANVQLFGAAFANYTGKFQASGQLSFLNDWKYELGAEILVPRGRQELFQSGILHYYDYAQLYNPNSKIIVRTTTQDRMLKVCQSLPFSRGRC